MKKKFIERLHVIKKNPSIIFEYCTYRYKLILSRGDSSKIKKINSYGSIISGFNGFSEYKKLAEFNSGSDVDFLINLSEKKSNLVIFDVGANLGVFSLFCASRLGRLTTIYAFEPMPSTYSCLERNIKLNSLDNIMTFNMAVGNLNGPIYFDASESSRATAKISEAAKDTTAVCVTLDRICAERAIDKIDILKVDVEGYELDVFMGASNLLVRHAINIIYFEFCPNNIKSIGRELFDVCHYIEKFSYKIYSVEHDFELKEYSKSDLVNVGLTDLVALSPNVAKQVWVK